MTSITIKDKYPVQMIEILKTESIFQTVSEIVDHIEEKVKAHPVATYIATFDHYTHTKGLPEHAMKAEITDAKIAIFCFGKELPAAQMAALRPRSVAVVDEGDKFIISFLDAPNPQAHEAMIGWVKSIIK